MAKTKTFNQLIIDRKNRLILLDGEPVTQATKLTLVIDGFDCDLELELVEHYSGRTEEIS